MRLGLYSNMGADQKRDVQWARITRLEPRFQRVIADVGSYHTLKSRFQTINSNPPNGAFLIGTHI